MCTLEHFKSAYGPLWYSQFNKGVYERGDFLLSNALDLNLILSEFNTPHFYRCSVEHKYPVGRM